MAVTAQQGALDRPAATVRTPGPRARRGRARVGLTLRVVLAVVVSVVMGFPLWVMIVTALSGPSGFSPQLDLLPRNITLENFARVFSAWPVGQWFSNSVTV